MKIRQNSYNYVFAIKHGVYPCSCGCGKLLDGECSGVAKSLDSNEK